MYNRIGECEREGKINSLGCSSRHLSEECYVGIHGDSSPRICGIVMQK